VFTRDNGGAVVARKVEIQLLDDIDGGKADETLRFGLDGTDYEADLSAKHADKLRSALAKYILKARRVGRGHVVPTARNRTGGSARSDRAQNQAIREWAKRKGIELSDRGRIRGDVVERYEAEAGR
jgi:hypothetical protein